MKVFGMEIISYDPFSTEEHAQNLGVKLVELDELYQLDYADVHTPLTEKTKGLISLSNKESLKKIRLVNCARGGIYEEADLTQLLDEGLYGWCALDVYSTEPPPEIYQITLIQRCCTLIWELQKAEKVAEQIASQMASI